MRKRIISLPNLDDWLTFTGHHFWTGWTILSRVQKYKVHGLRGHGFDSPVDLTFSTTHEGENERAPNAKTPSIL